MILETGVQTGKWRPGCARSARGPRGPTPTSRPRGGPLAPRPHAPPPTHSVPTRGAAAGSKCPGRRRRHSHERGRPDVGPAPPPPASLGTPHTAPPRLTPLRACAPRPCPPRQPSREAAAGYSPRRRPSRSKSRWVTGRSGGKGAAIVPPSRPSGGGEEARAHALRASPARPEPCCARAAPGLLAPAPPGRSRACAFGQAP